VGLTTRVHLKKWKLKQQFKYLAEALRHESWSTRLLLGMVIAVALDV
jgi:hypothetical protein